MPVGHREADFMQAADSENRTLTRVGCATPQPGSELPQLPAVHFATETLLDLAAAYRQAQLLLQSPDKLLAAHPHSANGPRQARNQALCIQSCRTIPGTCFR